MAGRPVPVHHRSRSGPARRTAGGEANVKGFKGRQGYLYGTVAVILWILYLFSLLRNNMERKTVKRATIAFILMGALSAGINRDNMG
jgi:hypothetical protein